MKKIITLVIILFTVNSFSQEFFNISVDNPNPRVGDIVKLTFEIDPFKKELETQIPDGVIVTSSKDIFGMSDNNLSKSLEFEKAGEYMIGPFIFELNDSIYITDSVKIVVSPRLPFEPGVWVRYYEQDGKRFLVLEQYTEVNTKVKKTRKETTYYTGGDLDDFTSIKVNPQEGVSISSGRSMSTTKREKGADAFTSGLRYSRKVYEITFDSSFNGTFKLKKEHFEDFPRKTDLDVILIQL